MATSRLQPKPASACLACWLQQPASRGRTSTPRAAAPLSPAFGRRFTPGARHATRQPVGCTSDAASALAAATSGGSQPQQRSHSQLAAPLSTSFVTTLNAALDAAPLLTLLAFVAVDAGSALCLWGVLEGVGAQVDGTFAAAYALSKSIRLQRLPLDAAAASALARAWPALAAVRVSRLLDAAADVSFKVKAACARLLPGRRSSPDAGAAPARHSALLSSAAFEAKRLADEYGASRFFSGWGDGNHQH